MTKQPSKQPTTSSKQASAKPMLQLTAKKLPTLRLTTYPNRPVKGATNLRLANKGKNNA